MSKTLDRITSATAGVRADVDALVAKGKPEDAFTLATQAFDALAIAVAEAVIVREDAALAARTAGVSVVKLCELLGGKTRTYVYTMIENAQARATAVV